MVKNEEAAEQEASRLFLIELFSTVQREFEFSGLQYLAVSQRGMGGIQRGGFGRGFGSHRGGYGSQRGGYESKRPLGEAASSCEPQCPSEEIE